MMSKNAFFLNPAQCQEFVGQCEDLPAIFGSTTAAACDCYKFELLSGSGAASQSLGVRGNYSLLATGSWDKSPAR